VVDEDEEGASAGANEEDERGPKLGKDVEEEEEVVALKDCIEA